MTNLAEVITDMTITEEINAAKRRLGSMRKNHQEALQTLHNYQGRKDRLDDQVNELFYILAEDKNEDNQKKYDAGKEELRQMKDELEEAQTAEKKLPPRIKKESMKLYSLNSQLQTAITEKARRQFGEKRAKVEAAAEKALFELAALVAVTSPSSNVERMTSVGDIDVHRLVTEIVSRPAFRESLVKQYDKYVKDLEVEKL